MFSNNQWKHMKKSSSIQYFFPIGWRMDKYNGWKRKEAIGKGTGNIQWDKIRL